MGYEYKSKAFMWHLMNVRSHRCPFAIKALPECPIRWIICSYGPAPK